MGEELDYDVSHAQRVKVQAKKFEALAASEQGDSVRMRRTLKRGE
jgi:hypothetical protein